MRDIDTNALSPDASVYQENEQGKDEGTQKDDALETEDGVNLIKEEPVQASTESI